MQGQCGASHVQQCPGRGICGDRDRSHTVFQEYEEEDRAGRGSTDRVIGQGSQSPGICHQLRY